MVTAFVHLRRVFFFVFGLTLVVTRPALCQQAYVYVHIDNGPTACQVDIAAGFHTANIYVVASHAFSGVEFSAPLPAGLGYAGESSNFVALGNSQTGVQIAIGACQPAPPVLEVLRINFFAPAALNDVTWTLAPAPDQETIRLVDCTGTWMKGAGEYSPYCDEGAMLGPYKPSPPDGATNVPLDQALSFTGAANVLFLGTDTEMNELDVQCGLWLDPDDACVFPFQADLAPNTTYYWKAYNVCCCCPHGDYGTSDVWSFTTGDRPLAVTTTTWGRVKAMYRD